jgi:molybdopterin biosynthesis enzyme
MRPIRETIPLDEALATILEAALPIARTERMPLRDAAGRVIAAPPPARWTCRRSIAPRWTATPCAPRTRSAPGATTEESCASSRRSTPRRSRRERSAPASASEIATGAPMPRAPTPS